MLEAAEPPVLPRRCRVLTGERAAVYARLGELLNGQSGVLWVGDSAPAGIAALPQSRFRDCLGSECGLLVFDTHTGLHPDALAAVLGTLAGGGECWLLVADWQRWATEPDALSARLAPFPLDQQAAGHRFLARLKDGLSRADCVSIEPVSSLSWSAPSVATGVSSEIRLTPEQQAVVRGVNRVAFGHARRPLVITADRGRGKSTALGSTLAALLRERDMQVMVLGPGPAAVGALFRQLLCELPDMHGGNHDYHWQGSRVWFRQAHDQLDHPQACDLLVIDEAAAIGLGQLRRLLCGHNRVVFSTTVHGYEGSGRGFVLRFTRMLDRLRPQWRPLHLKTPVRWAAGDPLEGLLNRTMLLDVGGASPPDGELDFRWLDQADLAADEPLLQQVFGLLVAAHYQTRPSDLQQLLDAPRLRILLALQGGIPSAVLLLAEEGGFDQPMLEAVCRGQRRPHGHMLVQSLAQHAGFCQAPRLHLWRVMRIAVREDRRRQGVGSALLERAGQQALSHGVDLLGSAFALDHELLPFWREAGFEVARLGERLDPASGMYSVQVLRGISESGRALQGDARRRFLDRFPWRLGATHRDLGAEMAVPLLRGRDCADLPLDSHDLSDVKAFAQAQRGLGDASPALWRWAVGYFAAQTPPEPNEAELLLSVVLQNHSPRSVARRTGIVGRRLQQRALRELVKKLLLEG